MLRVRPRSVRGCSVYVTNDMPVHERPRLSMSVPPVGTACNCAMTASRSAHRALSDAATSRPVTTISYEIVVTGRLVAASESALWALRDAVIAQLQAVPTGGTLIDNLGRSWTGMSFVTYTEQPRTDRGRTRSIGYTAVFKKL